MAARDQNGCVLTCTVGECSYNQELECLAPEIMVGDDHPRCDTFTRDRISMATQDAIVMTCAVAACAFNDDQHCHARGVTVDHHSGHADCVTFRP